MTKVQRLVLRSYHRRVILLKGNATDPKMKMDKRMHPPIVLESQNIDFIQKMQIFCPDSREYKIANLFRKDKKSWLVPAMDIRARALER